MNPSRTQGKTDSNPGQGPERNCADVRLHHRENSRKSYLHRRPNEVPAIHVLARHTCLQCAAQHDSRGCHMSAPEELASKHLLRRRACACWGPPLRSRGAASRLLSQPAQRMLRRQMPGGPDPDCSAIFFIN